jgi:hypothetical protein
LGLGGTGTYVPGTTQNFSYTGASQTFTASVSGSYTFETWGAQGGSGGCYSSCPNSSIGGKGGFASGSYALVAGQTINVYVGGVGQGHATSNTLMSVNSPKAGGWNGGGSNLNTCCTGTAGGGATDIRVNGTALTDRVIVAGGGGGGGNAQSATVTSNGGAGGGSTLSTSTQFYGRSPGRAGAGSLGVGSNATADWNQNLTGAGGGGYYGGTVGDNSTGGGGGSSYTGGVTGGVAVAGSSSMTAPDGTSQTAQSGHG